jgi:hypothetical protein
MVRNIQELVTQHLGAHHGRKSRGDHQADDQLEH